MDVESVSLTNFPRTRMTKQTTVVLVHVRDHAIAHFVVALDIMAAVTTQIEIETEVTRIAIAETRYELGLFHDRDRVLVRIDQRESHVPDRQRNETHVIATIIIDDVKV